MAFNERRKYIFSKDAILLALAAIFLVLAGIINFKSEKPIIELTKQDTALNINKNLLLYLNLGNKPLLTDLLWIQTLIESDTDHYSKKDLNNWLFLRFDSIATLDPKFYENYLFGGQFLGIVKDDLEGANVIYKKGLEFFPNDYKLNFNAGFLNYYEMGNYKQGLEYLQKIENNPQAPSFIKSIVNKLKLATGTDLEEVFKLVYYNYETAKEPSLKRRLRSDLYAIKARIDLDCLNNSKKNCNQFDLEKNKYIYKDGSWKSEIEFKTYEIKKME